MNTSSALPTDQAPTTTPQDNKSAPTVGEKLQKLLANAGLGSRRQLESVIESGRVSINGKVASLGDRASTTDEIRIDGRVVRLKSKYDKRRRVIAYYKPEGEICSANDPEGRTTVFERLPKLTGDRWIMVGRLDINSSGLLLFTNDGELAHRLMHPSSEIVREYAVRVLGEVTPEIAKNLTAGVELEDGVAKFDDIKEGGGTGVNKWYHVTLKEGRKREVRRLFESQGLKVSRLLRTRYGSFKLPSNLKTARFIELDKSDIAHLANLVGLKPHQNAGLTDSAKQKQARIHKKAVKSIPSHNKNQQKPKKDDSRRHDAKKHDSNKSDFSRLRFNKV